MNTSESPDWRVEPAFKVIPGVFSPRECMRIMALSQVLEPVVNRLPGRDRMVRDSRIYWTTRHPKRTQWMYDRLTEVVTAWNTENYRFDIDGCPEEFQLTCYDVGQMYDWHQDLGRGPTCRRKASVTTLLSDPTTFDGGNLEFFVSDSHRPAPDLKIGDVVIFPSFLKHRVTPVTRGARWSLVGWFTGPPLR